MPILTILTRVSAVLVCLVYPSLLVVNCIHSHLVIKVDPETAAPRVLWEILPVHLRNYSLIAHKRVRVRGPAVIDPLTHALSLHLKGMKIQFHPGNLAVPRSGQFLISTDWHGCNRPNIRTGFVQISLCPRWTSSEAQKSPEAGTRSSGQRLAVAPRWAGPAGTALGQKPVHDRENGPHC